MFNPATSMIRESIYGIWSRTPEGTVTHHGTGSGFMIAPGYMIGNSHVLHRNGEVIRST